MEFRYLGNSGLKISEIAYGNWITHGSQVEEATAQACIKAALDAGITTFDTADVYANTAAESVLGRGLAGLRRESLEIFTKVYWPTGPGGPNDSGLSRKHIMESCNASLKRLGTDYIDLYQAHRFDYETPLEETLRAFDDLVRQGKVLYVGVSEWKAKQINKAVKMAKEMGFDRIISNQPQYSAIYRVIEGQVVPISRKHGLGQVVWSPMAQGVLTGKYLPGHQFPAGSRAATEAGERFMSWLTNEETLTAVQRLRPVAEQAGLTMAQLAVAWVLQNDNVSCAIVGASRPEQVSEAVGASGVKLSPATMLAIDEVLADIIVSDPAQTESPKTRP